MSQDVLASKRPGFRLGRVKIAFKGRMSNWPKGTRVKIWSDGRTVTIERLKWTGSLVPLAHSCYGVQRRLVEFDKDTNHRNALLSIRDTINAEKIGARQTVRDMSKDARLKTAKAYAEGFLSALVAMGIEVNLHIRKARK